MHSPHTDGMEVSADDQGDALGLGRHRLHQPVVLLEPPRLPVRLRNRRGQETCLPIQNVRIPFAPLPRTPPEGIRGSMDQVPHLGRAGALHQPVLDLTVDEDRGGSRQTQGAANVVEQNLREPPVTDGPEALRQVAPVSGA